MTYLYCIAAYWLICAIFMAFVVIVRPVNDWLIAGIYILGGGVTIYLAVWANLGGSKG